MSTDELAGFQHSATTDDASYTEHIEPAAQGGERYVRCEGCGRELLVALGGREQFPHRDECPNA